MSAMTLQGVERNATVLEGGFSATSREQEAQKMQLMQLQCQMYEIAHPAMFTAVHYTQIDVGVLEDMQRLVLQSQEDLTQRLVSEIELRSLVRIGWRLIVSSYLNTRVRRTSRWFLDGLPFSSLKRGQIQLLALYGPVQSGMETILSAAMADLSASCASPGHRCVIVFRFECEEQPRRPQYLVFPLLYQLLSYFDTPPTWFDTSRLEAKLSQDEIMDFLHHLIDDLAPRRIYIIVAGSNIQHVDILYELLSRHSNVSALISLNSTTPCPIPPGLSSTVLPMCTDLIRREMDLMLNNVVMPGNTLAQIKDTMVVQRTLDRYRGNFPDVRQFEIDVIWIAKLAKTPIEVLQWLDMLVDNTFEGCIHRAPVF
ncbi:hypothetical protein BD626DRAFT_149730 [Schizophyllum amplum]|uniref:Uncharacterized protein n=1 Tax=Schizophyllum amplum TaxID=97359 RepID=A0A550C468_9AGAR|nr:hypothetical protein BD626DRAFT_149730 [Auriculariopsis ampla]